MKDTDKLDLIVFGATGFTGKLVCEYFSKNIGKDNNIHWGIAGRNRDKLNALTAELGLGDIPLFIVDVEDKASLDAMASACKVVLNTAGPYAKYGSNVVESCARLGTDHVDLNGEPLWMMQRMQKQLRAMPEHERTSVAEWFADRGQDDLLEMNFGPAVERAGLTVRLAD